MAIQHTKREWKSRANATSLGGDRYANRLEIYATPENGSKNHINIICTLDDIYYSSPYSQSIVRQEANSQLICDAVNNTANKGIDPNSIPALLQACKNAHADLVGIMPEFEPSGDRKHSAWTTLDELAQAIKSADLK